MRNSLIVVGVSALLLLSVPSAFSAPAPAKSSAGTIVIVFKDGHKQSFNLADIERMEFPGRATASTDSAPYNPAWPPRGSYFGKWETGDGSGGTFFITLKENGQAHRTLNAVDGHWVYVNGEAQITWNDGAMDAIRKVGNSFRKYAYGAGKSFTDKPDNEGEAHNTVAKPI